ncbi:ATP-dependent DEAD/H RNA helicase, putative [Trypanosoma equiperdum]|uniref:ATP-dependent DEAD/H RNA helicase, putative n=1 Tax=Trypanosoma equiperdum TaxID=5694 RepID=A0A1G4HZB0_TRYEQ|nr:ATP-dependent DEAD/H RNA helicase, putative [Trypanosoma equiperdum]
MATQQRDLNLLFGNCLKDDDFLKIPMDTVGALQAIFEAKNIPIQEEADASYEGKIAQVARRRSALSRVCDAVLSAFRNGGKPPAGGIVGTLKHEEEERNAWKFLVAAVQKDGKMRAVIEEELLRTAVEHHYATARPELCDMFAHLAATEMFFIDGDSLFMSALSPPYVDWDLIQPLHVMYNAQKLLFDMECRGARFHIVFFDSMLWMWERAPAKMLMRENLRLALTAASECPGGSRFTVRTFPSFHSEAFETYLKEWEPEFIFMSDGEQLGSLNPLQEFFVNPEVETTNASSGVNSSGAVAVPARRPYRSIVEDEEIGNDAAMYIRCLLLWAASRRLKVAYSSRVIYRENSMIVFTMGVDGSTLERSLGIEPEVRALAQSLEREVTLPTLSQKSLNVLNEDLTFREKIVCSAVRTYLTMKERSEQEQQLCQALVITAYIVGILSCEARAQAALPSAVLQNFIADISPFLLSALRHAGCDNGGGQVFDIIDGHLLYAVARLLREEAPSHLLDEDGVGDISMTWQYLMDDDTLDITSTPFRSLPELAQPQPVQLQEYPYLKHELVEHLAKTFKVEGHKAKRPIPDGYGAANELIGWDITTPFDKFNDVTDADGEREAKIHMTEKEARHAQEFQTKFVRNAFQQAQSMGISGFAAQPLTLVCSDNEQESTDAAGSGGAGGCGKGAAAKKKKGNNEHEGQRNKKGRSKDDEIREQKNLKDAASSIQSWLKQMDDHLRSIDPTHGRTTNKDRDDAVKKLLAAVKRLAEAKFTKGFEPDRTIGKSEGSDISLKISMWRLLVASSGLREAEFALTLEDPSAKNRAVKKKGLKTETAVPYGFTVIDNLVATISDKSTEWGELEGLRKFKSDITSAEAASYLRWVYLSYVELHIQMKIKCFVVKLRLENWRSERERARLAKETPDLSVAIPLFLYCHHHVLSVVQNEGLQISQEDLDTVRSALRHLDFGEDYYSKLDRAITQWQNKAPSLLGPTMLPRMRQLTDTPEMMQLIHMGHLLERPVIRRPDYRVAFNPDSWQRELLDIVDNRGSAVVCAPTSAGKTFVSYYCMYNTLRRSNRRIVVYLAPARALINQAVADVCARYGSKEYKNSGKYIYGVLGGADYHQFHDSCQVLLTVPETFETMLLSPKYAEWVDLIDYVILDEIHSMESNGNGDVWERILALLPCPFVALSATLGETQQLCGWLNRVQSRLKEQAVDTPAKARDYRVHVLPSEGQTIQRWNDIKKYIYLPPPDTRTSLKKLTTTYENRYIHDLHPLSILTTDQLQRGFPPDITLVPSEVVSLFGEMRTAFDNIIWPKLSSIPRVQMLQSKLKLLEPGRYFEADLYITQQRARLYEREVKDAFAQWVLLSNSSVKKPDISSDEQVKEFNSTMKHATETILAAFAQKLNEKEAALGSYAVAAMERKRAQQQSRTNTEGRSEQESDEAVPEAAFPGSRQFIREQSLNVLREISARDMGPAIVFSFESEDCEDLVKYVVEQLEEAEERYRQTEEFALYKAKVERAAAEREARHKQRESTLKQKRLRTNEDGEVERAERDVDEGEEDEGEVCEVPDILPEFTFIGAGCSVEPDVVKELIKDCEGEGEDLLLRALKRGIGMHHAGVKGKLRGHVERLFRGRHCGVIFSTETLALGIHSPCRSVVLAGDHILLNPTQFRQMMGRAGRRGLDHLGHLIFLGITMQRIKRLMTSGMTVIKGNVQMDPISQLRLLQLYDYNTHRSLKHEDAWKQHVKKLAERLFVNPLFFQRREAFAQSNMEGFTIEYLQMLLVFLQKQGLHFRDRPSSLGSLLQDVMYVFREAHVGNEGFAFIRMLTSGVFHEAHYPPALDKELHSGVTDEPIAELLAYLFSFHQTCGVPLEIHRSALLDPAVSVVWEGKTNATQHRVVLSPVDVCSPSVRPFDNTEFFALLSAFYNQLASRLDEKKEKEEKGKEQEEEEEEESSEGPRLPYVETGGDQLIFGNGAGDFPLMDALKESAVQFKARHPFVAISGCGDVFTSVDEVVFSLRDDLFCDRRLLPVLDVSDGWRHDGAQVLINACLADFLRVKAQIDTTRKNYRFTMLEELNGLSQSLSYSVLNRAEKLISNLAGLVRKAHLPAASILTAIMPDESFTAQEEGYSAGAPRLLKVAERLNSLQLQIQKRFAEEKYAAKKAKWVSELAAKRNEQK